MGSALGQYSKTFWCVAKIKPGKDQIARSQLVYQGYETFCPKLPALRASGGARREGVRPLFPGYCFVRVNPGTRGWKPVTGTIGVSKLIAFGDQPARMPVGAVERMIDLCDREGCLPCDRDLQRGDAIRIHGGPFDDWLGEVVSTREPDRIIVLVDLMSRRLPLTIDRSRVRSIRKISSNVQTA